MASGLPALLASAWPMGASGEEDEFVLDDPFESLEGFGRALPFGDATGAPSGTVEDMEGQQLSFRDSPLYRTMPPMSGGADVGAAAASGSHEVAVEEALEVVQSFPAPVSEPTLLTPSDWRTAPDVESPLGKANRSSGRYAPVAVAATFAAHPAGPAKALPAPTATQPAYADSEGVDARFASAVAPSANPVQLPFSWRLESGLSTSAALAQLSATLAGLATDVQFNARTCKFHCLATVHAPVTAVVQFEVGVSLETPRAEGVHRVECRRIAGDSLNWSTVYTQLQSVLPQSLRARRPRAAPSGRAAPAAASPAVDTVLQSPSLDDVLSAVVTEVMGDFKACKVSGDDGVAGSSAQSEALVGADKAATGEQLPSLAAASLGASEASGAADVLSPLERRHPTTLVGAASDAQPLFRMADSAQPHVAQQGAASLARLATHGHNAQLLLLGGPEGEDGCCGFTRLGRLALSTADRSVVASVATAYANGFDAMLAQGDKGSGTPAPLEELDQAAAEAVPVLLSMLRESRGGKTSLDGHAPRGLRSDGGAVEGEEDAREVMLARHVRRECCRALAVLAKTRAGSEALAGSDGASALRQAQETSDDAQLCAHATQALSLLA